MTVMIVRMRMMRWGTLLFFMSLGAIMIFTSKLHNGRIQEIQMEFIQVLDVLQEYPITLRYVSIQLQKILTKPTVGHRYSHQPSKQTHTNKPKSTSIRIKLSIYLLLLATWSITNPLSPIDFIEKRWCIHILTIR